MSDGPFLPFQEVPSFTTAQVEDISTMSAALQLLQVCPDQNTLHPVVEVAHVKDRTLCVWCVCVCVCVCTCACVRTHAHERGGIRTIKVVCKVYIRTYIQYICTKRCRVAKQTKHTVHKQQCMEWNEDEVSPPCVSPCWVPPGRCSA